MIIRSTQTYLFSSNSGKPFESLKASSGNVAFLFLLANLLNLVLPGSRESVVSILTLRLLSSRLFNFTMPSTPANSLLRVHTNKNDDNNNNIEIHAIKNHIHAFCNRR